MPRAAGLAVEQLRALRAIGRLPRPRRGPQRLPAQQQPDAIRLAYWRAITALACAPARAALAEVQDEILHLLDQEQLEREERRDAARLDAGRAARAQAIVQRAAGRFTAALRPQALHEVAAQFGERTAAWQRGQLDQQVRAAVGVGIVAVEAPVRQLLPRFAQSNTDLIRTVPARYWDRIALDTQAAFAGGSTAADLAEDFADDFDVSERDALRLARDQIGKLNAQCNQERQEALGVTRYVWRTMNDGGVRAEHAPLEGQIFDWDDPPDAGTDGEPANPGEAIQCRCYAEPVIGDLLE